MVYTGGRFWPGPCSAAIESAEGAVRYTLTGLSPSTEYRYAWVSADKTRRSVVGRFRTAAARTADSSERIVRIGATSCLGNKNPTFPTLAHAAAESLDAFVLLGDAIYTKTQTLRGYRIEYDTLLSVPAFQALSASTSLVPIWDDHEVANDWVFTSVPPHTGEIVDADQFAAARAAFDEALPHGSGPDEPLWRRLRLSDLVELIVLDCRSERDLVREQMVGEAQLAWALDALATSTAVFKIIVTSTHAADHGDRVGDGNLEERWQWFADQRATLVEAAAETPGAVFLTGNMHYGGLQRIAPAGDPGGALWEVAAGPCGSGAWDVATWFLENGGITDQYAVLLDTWNYALLEAVPAGTDGNDGPELRVSFVGDDGEVFASRTLLVG